MKHLSSVVCPLLTDTIFWIFSIGRWITVPVPPTTHCASTISSHGCTSIVTIWLSCIIIKLNYACHCFLIGLINLFKNLKNHFFHLNFEFKISNFENYFLNFMFSVERFGDRHLSQFGIEEKYQNLIFLNHFSAITYYPRSSFHSPMGTRHSNTKNLTKSSPTSAQLLIIQLISRYYVQDLQNYRILGSRILDIFWRTKYVWYKDNFTYYEHF